MPVYIHGLTELQHASRLIGRGTGKQLAVVNQRGGNLFVDEARRRAPKGPHEGGGHVTSIERSIRAARQPNAVLIRAGGNSAPQAAIEEFGGHARRFHSQKRTTVRARPYLYPAVEAKKAEFEQMYVTELDRLLATWEAI